MARHRATAAWMVLMMFGTASTSMAQTPGFAPLPKVSNVRLYVIDCGTIIASHPESQNLTREEVGNPNHADSCFLVMHPGGLLLFDTGLKDDLVGRPIYENMMGSSGQLKFTTLRSELAKIGVAPAAITYLALSHSHWDHVGNANDYAASTWLARKAEFDFMFGPNSTRSTVFQIGRNNYAALAQARTQYIDGEYDVFGDGRVVLLSTPGHTPGHQCLYVKLAQTGGVVISGDMYHYTQERKLGRMAVQEQNNADSHASRRKIEDFLVRTNSQLWISHAIDWFRDSVKAPGWYE